MAKNWSQTFVMRFRVPLYDILCLIKCTADTFPIIGAFGNPLGFITSVLSFQTTRFLHTLIPKDRTPGFELYSIQNSSQDSFSWMEHLLAYKRWSTNVLTKHFLALVYSRFQTQWSCYCCEKCTTLTAKKWIELCSLALTVLCPDLGIQHRDQHGKLIIQPTSGRHCGGGGCSLL